MAHGSGGDRFFRLHCKILPINLARLPSRFSSGPNPGVSEVGGPTTDEGRKGIAEKGHKRRLGASPSGRAKKARPRGLIPTGSRFKQEPLDSADVFLAPRAQPSS